MKYQIKIHRNRLGMDATTASFVTILAELVYYNTIPVSTDAYTSANMLYHFIDMAPNSIKSQSHPIKNASSLIHYIWTITVVCQTQTCLLYNRALLALLGQWDNHPQKSSLRSSAQFASCAQIQNRFHSTCLHEIRFTVSEYIYLISRF